ncbi:MAG: NAD(P)/FAD-dependent oxidoreductase [Novosphingobium sp.]|nr:NAD(P)/FAD-dependent oxidoreductase [Novosphingobium sp.]
MSEPSEHHDVIIVGAGLSGVGAAAHLRARCPNRSFIILEARGAIGGTWDLFRYPGIRSDSDMYTLGYEFKPWRGEAAIADGQSILDHIRSAADEAGVTQAIRFEHKVTSANWSSLDARWTVTVATPRRFGRPDGSTGGVCPRCHRAAGYSRRHCCLCRDPAWPRTHPDLCRGVMLRCLLGARRPRADAIGLRAGANRAHVLFRVHPAVHHGSGDRRRSQWQARRGDAGLDSARISRSTSARRTGHCCAGPRQCRLDTGGHNRDCPDLPRMAPAIGPHA